MGATGCAAPPAPTGSRAEQAPTASWAASAADTLAGGPGADTLLARDGVKDKVVGGLGRDSGQVDRKDRVLTLERRVA